MRCDGHGSPRSLVPGGLGGCCRVLGPQGNGVIHDPLARAASLPVPGGTGLQGPSRAHLSSALRRGVPVPSGLSGGVQRKVPKPATFCSSTAAPGCRGPARSECLQAVGGFLDCPGVSVGLGSIRLSMGFLPALASGRPRGVCAASPGLPPVVEAGVSFSGTRAPSLCSVPTGKQTPAAVSVGGSEHRVSVWPRGAALFLQ